MIFQKSLVVLNIDWYDIVDKNVVVEYFGICAYITTV